MKLKRIDPMLEDVKCVGTGAADGCGHTGGQSGHVCPQCGGMLLSKLARTRAIKLVLEWHKQYAERTIT